jgi:putative DNA primase/helicase
MKYEVLLQTLQRLSRPVKSISGGVLTTCPAHDDKVPSLKVTATPDGEALLHCFAGCSYEDVVAAYARLGVLLKPRRFTPTKADVQDIEAVYPYTTPDGELLFEVIRLKGKRFFQRRPAKGRYQYKGISSLWTLYNLPEVVKAPPEKPIWIVEGEKDVESLRQIGEVATCNPGGAGKWKSQYSRFLANRNCIVVPDNDEVGLRHARQVADNLVEVAKSVKLVSWQALGVTLPGFDITNWLQMRRTVSELAFEEVTVRVSSEDPLTAFLRTFPFVVLTEVEIARAFATYYSSYRWSEAVGWYHWNGLFWEAVPDSSLAVVVAQFVQRLREVVDAPMQKQVIRLETAHRVFAIEKLVRGFMAVGNFAYKDDKHILVTSNGWVDLRSGEFTPPSSDYWVTCKTSVGYDPTARAPKWEAFVEGLFSQEGEEDKRYFEKLLKRSLGYSVTGNSEEQVFFMLWGRGANGKSTLLAVILDVLAGYGVNVPFTTFEATLSYTGAPSSDVAMLAGKRFVTASEAGSASRLNEARLKGLVGGERVTARKMYRDFFEFEPICKIWLSVNRKPDVHDSSQGFWRRLVLFPFTNEIPPDQIDLRLKDKLLQEAPGILTWLVEGAKDWYELGLPKQEPLTELVKAYQKDSDVLADFVDDCLLEDPFGRVKGSDLYSAYLSWCEGEKVPAKNILSPLKFHNLLKNRFRFVRAAQGRFYLGVGLKGRESLL